MRVIWEGSRRTQLPRQVLSAPDRGNGLVHKSNSKILQKTKTNRLRLPRHPIQRDLPLLSTCLD